MIQSSSYPPSRQLDQSGLADDHDDRPAVTPLAGTRSAIPPPSVIILWSGSLVAPVTPDIGMADNGVIAVSVAAVIASPITISRVAITVSGIAIGWSVSVSVA